MNLARLLAEGRMSGSTGALWRCPLGCPLAVPFGGSRLRAKVLRGGGNTRLHEARGPSTQGLSSSRSLQWHSSVCHVLSAAAYIRACE
ncbi:hypothetical protein HaLaN_26286 [Haematococcus lacustris]|uniref:Uncharacterized protein n=1 Tax=Haematococcus lacustris TaxID=44745 RepID=A0A6A0A5W5_HAELA|nr:hypothetical protein HaLaN_26286 [Haematococcus lacustris]